MMPRNEALKAIDRKYFRSRCINWFYSSSRDDVRGIRCKEVIYFN